MYNIMTYYTLCHVIRISAERQTLHCIDMVTQSKTNETEISHVNKLNPISLYSVFGQYLCWYLFTKLLV